MLGSPFARIYKILTPKLRRKTIALFVWMFLLASVELASILLLTFFFGGINNPDAVRKFWFVGKTLELFPALAAYVADHRRFMLVLSLLPVGAIVLKNTMYPFVYWRMGTLGQGVSAYIGNAIMRHFLYMPYKWHLSASSSEAYTKLGWRTSIAQTLIDTLQIYSNALTVGILFCGMLVVAPEITVIVLIVMGVTGYATYSLLRKQIDNHSKLSARYSAEEGYAAMAAVNGIQEVLIYQQQEAFLDSIRAPIDKGIPSRVFLSIAHPFPSWTLESCGFSLVFFVILIMTYVMDVSATRIISTVALLALTAWRVLPSLNRIVGCIVALRAQAGMFEPTIAYFESLTNQAQSLQNKKDPGFRFADRIRLDEVSFFYPTAEKPALDAIHLTIAKGQTIGLIGTSGAGKSTLINLLTGLLEPDEGAFTVDGRELTPEMLNAYRSRIGYVAQKPFLLPGTVAQNIAFSQWGKEYDEERVKRVCREACIDFLGQDCADINRMVGENGAGFSGGQAQRISIARALYPEPDILILDEATSSLDLASEAAVQRSLRNLKGRITTIISAHRLSTLEICDSLVWLEEGRIRVAGPPRDVLPGYTAWLAARAAEGDEEALRHVEEPRLHETACA